MESGGGVFPCCGRVSLTGVMAASAGVRPAVAAAAVRRRRLRAAPWPRRRRSCYAKRRQPACDTAGVPAAPLADFDTASPPRSRDAARSAAVPRRPGIEVSRRSSTRRQGIAKHARVVGRRCLASVASWSESHRWHCASATALIAGRPPSHRMMGCDSGAGQISLRCLGDGAAVRCRANLPARHRPSTGCISIGVFHCCLPALNLEWKVSTLGKEPLHWEHDPGTS